MIIGFIGAGKMARALAAGIVRGKVASPQDIVCSSRTGKSGATFLDQFPKNTARWTSDNVQLATECDPIVLAIKPQVFPDAVPPLRDASEGKLILSIAAGISLLKLAEWLHPTARIVRIMPNSPMQVGQGASVYVGGPNVTETDRALVHQILSGAGKAWQVDENQIDTITALSGSGPAYVFHFIEALIRAGVSLGLPEALARDLALQTVLGSAQLASGSSLSPMELAAQVKSPGGTTLAACAVLEKKDALNQLIAHALEAAKARAEALAEGASASPKK